MAWWVLACEAARGRCDALGNQRAVQQPVRAAAALASWCSTRAPKSQPLPARAAPSAVCQALGHPHPPPADSTAAHACGPHLEVHGRLLHRAAFHHQVSGAEGVWGGILRRQEGVTGPCRRVLTAGGRLPGEPSAGATAAEPGPSSHPCRCALRLGCAVGSRPRGQGWQQLASGRESAAADAQGAQGGQQPVPLHCQICPSAGECAEECRRRPGGYLDSTPALLSARWDAGPSETRSRVPGRVVGLRQLLERAGTCPARACKESTQLNQCKSARPITAARASWSPVHHRPSQSSAQRARPSCAGLLGSRHSPRCALLRPIARLHCAETLPHNSLKARSTAFKQWQRQRQRRAGGGERGEPPCSPCGSPVCSCLQASSSWQWQRSLCRQR